MRIAILHDYFDKRGGGERLVLNLARRLGADIFTGYIEKEKTFETTGIKITDLGVSRRLPAGLRHMALARKFEKFVFPDYDCYIFSGVWCITASRNNHPNVFYCHTPPRYMYDMKDYFIKSSSPIKRIALKQLISYWRPKDKKYMNFFDVICSNSENVKARIKKSYGSRVYKKCQVVYTGIDTKRFYIRKSEGFYLATQRLDKLKRVELIISAFKKMPEKRLIVTGTGPEEKNLKNLASGCRNIEFAGNVDEKTLLDLYARCRAVISAPVNEDLGLTAIEAQAAGKPVVAVKEGGLLETVIEGKTGVFFKPDAGSLIRAIDALERKKWNERSIIKNAKRFDIEAFKKTMTKMVELATRQRAVIR